MMVDALRTWQLRIRTVALVIAISLSALLVALAIVGQPALAQNDPLARADALNQEVIRLHQEGRYAEAVPRAREALALRERVLGPSHPDVAASLNNLAELLRNTGGYALARPLYERALKIDEQALGPDHPTLALRLNNLAELLQDTGDYSGAKPLLERALRIKEQALGPTHPDLALSLNNLAALLHTTGDYVAARPLYEQALRIFERAFGPTHPSVATSLNNLADLLQATGDYAGAKFLHERAIRINEQALGPTHPNVATSLNNLASVLQDTGDYARARPLFERALRINEQALGPTHPNVATSLNNLANLIRTTGDYAAARPLYERAIKINEQTLGSAHPLVATSLNNLALLLVEVGDHAAAPPLYERAPGVNEQAPGPTHPDVATSLNNLANLIRTTGDYAAALPLYERALKIVEQALGPTHRSVAVTLNNLAVLLQSAGDYAAAKPLYERALRVAEQVLGPTHPDVAAALNNLALVLMETGEYTVARSLYERALQITEAALGPFHPDVATRLNNLGGFLWEAGRPHDASPKLARAVTIMRAHTARGLVGLSHRQKLAFMEATSHYADSFLSLPPGLVPSADAYGSVLDRKNLLFRTLAAEHTLTEANPGPHVIALLREYTDIRRQLAGLTVRVPDPSGLQQYQLQTSTLSQRLEALEADLSRASAAFRQAQVEARAGPSDVCAAIPMDAALIDLFWYVRYMPPASPGTRPTWTPHYIAHILRGGKCTEPIRLDLGPAAPVDEDVRKFREALSREAYDPPARELRARYRKTLAARLKAKLFPPEIQAAIEGKPRLLISPDGALALLPFALLQGEDGHEFLLETRTISYVPSGRDLLRAAPSSSASGGLFAVGAPAFDRAPVQVAQAGSQRAGCGTPEDPFLPLPGTRAEVQAITRAYQQTNPTSPATVLEGAQATKAAFLEQAPKASVLHLATHAYFGGEDCTPAGLVPEQRRPGGEPRAFLGHNPLLLAGIALAGANDREKGDGILTALEVTALDLRGTDLVVLSACDTGLGTPARGQELLGLRWAFAYAGARNLVTSLWSVPDAETATLMTRFYTALWENGVSVPAALRAAQLEMLKASRAMGDSAPHAWGAFVASGRSD